MPTDDKALRRGERSPGVAILIAACGSTRRCHPHRLVGTFELEQTMDSVRATRVLVVASRTAATPWLLKEIERRSKAGPCEFVLLVPPANSRNPDWTLDVALAHVEQAAGQPVQTVECDRDYVGAVRRALSQRRYDEVIVSTRPPPGPKWLNPAPMRWLDELGVPVTAVVLGQRARLDRGVLKVRCD